jgi:hypothetical protein
MPSSLRDAHLWILVSERVLESITHGYWGTTLYLWGKVAASAATCVFSFIQGLRCQQPSSPWSLSWVRIPSKLDSSWGVKKIIKEVSKLNLCKRMGNILWKHSSVCSYIWDEWHLAKPL